MTFHVQLVEINLQPIKLIEQAYDSENLEYLCQEDDVIFPLLSQVDPYYPLELYPGNMSDLIKELAQVKLTLKDLKQISHVNEIISMSINCNLHQDSAIIFNPFGSKPVVVRSK